MTDYEFITDLRERLALSKRDGLDLTRDERQRMYRGSNANLTLSPKEIFFVSGESISRYLAAFEARLAHEVANKLLK